MKLVKLMTVVTVMSVMFSCNNNNGVSNKSLETEIDSVSYVIGYDVGRNARKSFKEINRDQYIQGFLSGLDSVNIKIDENEMKSVVGTYFQEKQQREQEKQFEGNKKEGEEFLEANKSKEGVQTTESGLQYIVLNEGSGEKPIPTDQVLVHYHGTFINGNVFDSSVDKGAPITHSASGFVPGFNEGLSLMNVGSKYRFFIPQELAYGANPRQGGPIEPFTTIIFEVELLEIK